MRTPLLNLQSYITLIALFLTTVTFGQDQYDSNGTTIWDAMANNGYNNSIRMIGRDDAISFNQKQNTATEPRVGLGTVATSNAANTNTFGGDRRYLVWGDNAGSMNDSGTDLNITFPGGTGVSTSIDIINKTWKVVETGGDVTTTQITIPTTDLSGLSALSGNDAYVLVVANDASFTSNVETIFLTKNGSRYEALYDFNGTKYFTYGVAHQSTFSRHASFDGIDDAIQFGAVNDLNTSFTIMFWVRPSQNDSAKHRTIASKYNGTSGYRVYLTTDNKINMVWTGGTPITSSVSLPEDEWHNVAFAYDGTILSLYIDGVLDTTVTSAPPTTNTHTFSIGAEYRNHSSIRNFFKGDLDEFRLWNKNVSQEIIQFIMNQEILKNGTATMGTIIPSIITKNEAGNLRWSNLVAYYSMNSFIGTTIDDDSAKNNRGTLVPGGQVGFSLQTAPMPYLSASNGVWTSALSWANGSSTGVPNSTSIVNPATKISWNIVKTNHNLTSNSDLTLLGLLVESNNLSIATDSKLEISHYLKLDGKIDLVDKSQLLQTVDSYLDENSSGYIERDQKGQSNIYNYNYWSSPVSAINNTENNAAFTVNNVMKDGTNSIPQNITWSNGIDGSPTSPITLASYWIFKFQELGNGTSNWSSVGQNGLLLPGQGFTLKGSGAATPNQNYTFVGKPNNGTITSTVSPNNLNLCGNPYPSAIDANEFIDDNASSILGTLYFWEHFNTNNSHATLQYQGGYATYTKVGGTVAIAPSGISNLGSSNKIPKRYIPVGQGFFVTGSETGGTITFKNSQRVFIKENNNESYQLFRASNTTITENSENNNNGSDEEQFTTLRLGFDSADNYHRQILLGFMNERATSGFDIGYDGLSFESLSNDMYFLNNNAKLNIQGVGFFNAANVYPIGVKNAIAGTVKFGIDTIENMGENQDIFIYDNVTHLYHSIKTDKFEIELPAGTFDSRFSLRFMNGNNALGTNQNELQTGITVVHSQSNQMITINNELQDTTVKSAEVYNMIGQNVTSWKLGQQDQNAFQLSVAGLSTGAYVVKVTTDKGITSKKFIVN